MTKTVLYSLLRFVRKKSLPPKESFFEAEHPKRRKNELTCKTSAQHVEQYHLDVPRLPDLVARSERESNQKDIPSLFQKLEMSQRMRRKSICRKGEYHGKKRSLY